MAAPVKQESPGFFRGECQGGLKGIEKTLGIARQDTDTDGRAAITLWDAWNRTGDRQHLDRLLDYNREDVENLVHLRRELAQRGFPT